MKSIGKDDFSGIQKKLELTGGLRFPEDGSAAVENWKLPKAKIWDLKLFNFFTTINAIIHTSRESIYT